MMLLFMMQMVDGQAETQLFYAVILSFSNAELTDFLYYIVTVDLHNIWPTRHYCSLAGTLYPHLSAGA